MGALLFVAAHAVFHPMAAKLAIGAVKVATTIGVGMLYDHIVLGD